MNLRTRNLAYASGLVVMCGVFAAVPFLITAAHPGNLTTQDAPLKPSQVMRGAYINSGSQDVGADPAWKTGRYVPTGAAHFDPSGADVAAARARLDARKREALAAAAAPPPAR